MPPSDLEKTGTHNLQYKFMWGSHSWHLGKVDRAVSYFYGKSDEDISTTKGLKPEFNMNGPKYSECFKYIIVYVYEYELKVQPTHSYIHT